MGLSLKERETVLNVRNEFRIDGLNGLNQFATPLGRLPITQRLYQPA